MDDEPLGIIILCVPEYIYRWECWVDGKWGTDLKNDRWGIKGYNMKKRENEEKKQLNYIISKNAYIVHHQYISAYK